MNRVLTGLRTVGCLLRGGEGAAAWRYLRGRIWCEAATVLFRCGEPAAGNDPPGLSIDRVIPADRPAHESALRTIGAGDDVRYFDAGAVCYLVRLHAVPVGVGWRFRDSYLLRRLALPRAAVYLGGFHVAEAARGQGVYQAMLRRMARDVHADGGISYAEAAPENAASRSGLTHAGFVPVVRLDVRVLLGVMVRCRVMPWTS